MISINEKGTKKADINTSTIKFSGIKMSFTHLLYDIGVMNVQWRLEP